MPFHCPKCAVGLPLCWEASGSEILWCTLVADLCPLGCFEPFSLWWYVATPSPLQVLWYWSHVAAPSCAPLCPSASVCFLWCALVCLTSWACCGLNSLPILVTAATAVTCWMRGSICDPLPHHHPPLSPALVCLPECGSGPWSAPCGLVALFSQPSIPIPLGWVEGGIPRVWIGHTWWGLLVGVPGLAPRATRIGGLVRGVWWGEPSCSCTLWWWWWATIPMRIVGVCDHYWQGQEVVVGGLVGFPALSALMNPSPDFITSWAF